MWFRRGGSVWSGPSFLQLHGLTGPVSTAHRFFAEGRLSDGPLPGQLHDRTRPPRRAGRSFRPSFVDAAVRPRTGGRWRAPARCHAGPTSWFCSMPTPVSTPACIVKRRPQSSCGSASASSCSPANRAHWATSISRCRLSRPQSGAGTVFSTPQTRRPQCRKRCSTSPTGCPSPSVGWRGACSSRPISAAGTRWNSEPKF